MNFNTSGDTRKQRTLFVMIILFSILMSIENSFSQQNKLNSYQYISPISGSSMILPETNIIIRERNKIDEATLINNNLTVIGSISGKHQGSLVLSDDQRTIIFKPFEMFVRGETVYVNFYGGIKNISGDELPSFSYEFNISERDPAIDYSRSINQLLELETEPKVKLTDKSSSESIFSADDDLPEDFPTITINISNNPTDGFLFISPFSQGQSFGYLIITDNRGVPIYYTKSNSQKHGFTVQSNGLLTYFDLNTQRFYAMDSSYTIVDTFMTGNGYITDIHELQILPDGHALIMAYDPQPVRMDTIVAGGDSSAIVVGLIIQELDVDKNVVFQWRSWDHFWILDATQDIHMDWLWIDYVHGNAIELDIDGNLLISCRNMDEITKISRQTGDIIWRLGGDKARNNDFLFINDPVTFSHQHDIRRLSNGNISLFDNGSLHSPKFSRAAEYQLDEENHIANLIWNFSYEPSIFSYAMANTQRLSNHCTIIGWGIRTEDMRAITEVKADGTVAFELSLPDTMYSYRAFRFSWKTNLFITDPDSIFFESIGVGDSSTTTINLVSNSAKSINITSFYGSDSAYSVVTTVPFTLPAYGTVPLEIKFKPYEEGYFQDVLHIRSDNENSRVAQLMVLAGRTDSTISFVDNQTLINDYRLEQNYPNPFNPATTIQYQIHRSQALGLAHELGDKLER